MSALHLSLHALSVWWLTHMPHVAHAHLHSTQVPQHHYQLQLLHCYTSVMLQLATLFPPRCPNTVSFAPKTGSQPSKSVTVRGTAPASGSWTISVTSATGSCGAFLNAQATVPMGKC